MLNLVKVIKTKCKQIDESLKTLDKDMETLQKNTKKKLEWAKQKKAKNLELLPL